MSGEESNNQKLEASAHDANASGEEPPPQGMEVIDLDDGSAPPPPPSVSTKPYDPDGTREKITFYLLTLLTFIVAFSFLAIVSVNMAAPPYLTVKFDNLEKVLDRVLGPVITLLSTAVGFYFGAKTQAGSGAKQ